MKISKKLRRFRTEYIKNTGKDRPSYSVLMCCEDFYKLLKEDESRLGYTITKSGLHWFDDFLIYRTEDMAQGEIKVIDKEISIY